jgi:hypothetical protein
MGRHSAPGEEEDTGPVDPAHAGAGEDEPSGRHAVRAEPGAGRPAPTRSEPAAVAPTLARGTAADLRLLRASGTLRTRAAAAGLLPFVLYTVVMVVIGRTDRFLVFLWAPIVVAGVCFGAVLDLGHRRRADLPTTDPPAPDR